MYRYRQIHFITFDGIPKVMDQVPNKFLATIIKINKENTDIIRLRIASS